jgi:hypothetical protein
VGYNAAEILLIFELKYFHENNFFSKMILTHESGAQFDHQFDGKKRRPKISWYYPFKLMTVNKSSAEKLGLDKLQTLVSTTRSVIAVIGCPQGSVVLTYTG